MPLPPTTSHCFPGADSYFLGTFEFFSPFPSQFVISLTIISSLSTHLLILAASSFLSAAFGAEAGPAPPPAAPTSATPAPCPPASRPAPPSPASPRHPGPWPGERCRVPGLPGTGSRGVPAALPAGTVPCLPAGRARRLYLRPDPAVARWLIEACGCPFRLLGSLAGPSPPCLRCSLGLFGLCLNPACRLRLPAPLPALTSGALHRANRFATKHLPSGKKMMGHIPLPCQHPACIPTPCPHPYTLPASPHPARIPASIPASLEKTRRASPSADLQDLNHIFDARL